MQGALIYVTKPSSSDRHIGALGKINVASNVRAAVPTQNSDDFWADYWTITRRRFGDEA